MFTILVLCTGNSCRSILAEALFNHLGQGRVRAFSAGSHPVGQVNEGALATLRRHGLPTGGYHSKSWTAFADQPIDLVVTVCDHAAAETCPAYLRPVPRAHWGVADPGRVEGAQAEQEAAFERTFALLGGRVRSMLALPLESLSASELAAEMDAIAASAADAGQHG